MPAHLDLASSVVLFADGVLFGLGWVVAQGVAWLIGTLVAKRTTP